MEKKLKNLFDYQLFEKNEKLQKLILDTESRYGKELSDNDLSLVNAAGEITANPVKKDENSALNGGGIYCIDNGSERLDGKSGKSIGSGGGSGGGGSGGGNGSAMSD